MSLSRRERKVLDLLYEHDPYGLYGNEIAQKLPGWTFWNMMWVYSVLERLAERRLVRERWVRQHAIVERIDAKTPEGNSPLRPARCLHHITTAGRIAMMDPLP